MSDIDMSSQGILSGRSYFDGVIIGVFGNTISNLTIDGPGFIHESSEISFVNVTFSNLQIDNSNGYQSTGGLVGEIRDITGPILFDTVTIEAGSSVIGQEYVGGFIGTASNWSEDTYDFQILNSVNSATVESLYYYTGGFMGYLEGSLHVTFRHLENHGTVLGDRAGGIAGEIYSSRYGSENITFFEVQNTGDVIGGSASGITSYISGTNVSIEAVSNEGTINGDSRANGIISSLYSTNTEMFNVRNSGDVTSINYASGIAYYISGTNISMEAIGNKGTISGGWMASGIVSEFSSTNNIEMFDIHNGGNVTANQGIVSGVAGFVYTDHLVMVNVLNEGHVTNSDTHYESYSFTSGIVAYLVATTFTGIALENHGNIIVENTENRAGGIIGFVDWSENFTLVDTLNTGSVMANLSAGGIIGEMGSYSYGTANIFHAVNSGNVNGYHVAGGIIGSIYNYVTVTIRNSVNSGIISSVYGDSGPIYGYIDSSSTITIL